MAYRKTAEKVRNLLRENVTRQHSPGEYAEANAQRQLRRARTRIQQRATATRYKLYRGG